jgi:class 3 adenylate cyclase
VTQQILVVEDSPDEAFVMRLRLEGERYGVLTAATGADALQLVAAGLADMVLLDVGLPDIDGYEVCRRIREWEIETYGHSPVIPVVMVTGRSSQERAGGLNAGADDFLTKPVNHEELLARVRSLLRIKTLHDQLSIRNRLLYDALQRSVSAPVAERIVEDPERYLQPGGERRTVSVLFADLRGYTNLAQHLAPDQAIVVLNTYLSHMIEVIYQYGGTVNQLLGDGVMAIFGAPMPFEDHAWRAAQAALDMRETAAGLQPPGLEETRLPMRIGITSGDVIVGHIGSERRVDYTAVGATVNLAARLQGLAETGDIMIDEAAYSRIEGDVVAEDGGMIPVRGFDEPIHVYRVLRRREARSSATSP